MLAQWQEVYKYREAVRHLVARDLKVRYSNSALGVVWSLFAPLLMTLVYSVVFTFFVPQGIPKFPVFLLAGLLPWTFFTASVAGATGIITGNGHLINRVYFPREVLPVANLLANAVNFGIALALLFGFVLVFRVRLGATLVWLPVIIAVQAVLTLGLGLFLAAVNVYLRDVQQVVDVALLAWFFLTPIIYRLEDTPLSAAAQMLVQVVNPMAGLVTAYRAVLYAGQAPDMAVLGIVAAKAALVFAVGALVFRRLSPAFAEAV
jgi:ABC-type polysaccharide/polyol phosphate export permease